MTVRRVLVCRCALLPQSETFIKEQILACSRWQPVLVGTHRVPGLDVEQLDTRMLYDSQASPSMPVKAYRKLIGQLDLAPRSIVRRLQEEGAAVVHVHFGTDAVVYWPFLRRLGLPVLVSLHGYDIQIERSWWESGAGGWLMRNYPQRLLAMGRHPLVRFIAVSAAIRERAIEYGLPAARIRTAHIGIDCRKFVAGTDAITTRSPRVLFVGRLVEKKGCEYLIRAMKSLQGRVPEAELVVAGDGPQRGALERLAITLAVKARFLGSVPHEEVQRQLAQARVFCLPSVRAANGDAEGFGLVILEAQACGVPVVTSAVGGAQEGIRDGVTGYSFAERDVTGLASKLTRLLTDDSLASAMSLAAPGFVRQHFDNAVLTERLEALYDSAATTVGRAIA